MLKYFLLERFLSNTCCWNCFCCFYYFVTRNHRIVNNTFSIFAIFTYKCRRTPSRNFFTHMIFFVRFLHSHRYLSLLHFWFVLLFLSSNLHLTLHDICFVNVSDSFIPYTKLKTRKFKSSVLFRTRTFHTSI